MVRTPSYSGTFDGLQPAVVQICRGTVSPCAETNRVATFTTTSGPGSETVRVNTTDQH